MHLCDELLLGTFTRGVMWYLTVWEATSLLNELDSEISSDEEDGN